MGPIIPLPMMPVRIFVMITSVVARVTRRAAVKTQPLYAPVTDGLGGTRVAT
jgi:hypothetical protein